MMKKSALNFFATTALILVFFTSAPLAWSKISLGILAGGNYANFSSGVDVTLSGGETSSLNPSGLFGYQFGMATRMEEANWILELDALYTSRSMRWNGTVVINNADYRYAQTYTLKQIEVPLIAYYVARSGGSNYRIGFGLYGSYGFGKLNFKEEASSIPGTVISESGSYSWETIGFRRVNLGGLVAFGADFKLGQKTRMTLDLRAQTTFTDVKNKLNPQMTGERFGWLGVDLLAGILF